MVLAGTNGDPRWYVIHTHPKQEERANSNLRAWQVETFAPKVRERLFKSYSRKPTFTEKPLFPRYIFARFDVDKLLHKVRYTRGIQDVISFGDKPTSVDEEVIELVQTRVNEDGFVRVGVELSAGDKVIIKGGPLKNFMGVFEREMNEGDRVRILLETVSYQPSIELERCLVDRVN